MDKPGSALSKERMKRVLIGLMLLVLTVGQTLAHARSVGPAGGMSGAAAPFERVCWRKQSVGPVENHVRGVIPASCEVVLKFSATGFRLLPPPLHHVFTPERPVRLSGSNSVSILRPPIA